MVAKTSSKDSKRSAVLMQGILPRGGWRTRAVLGFLGLLGALLILRLADHQVLMNHDF